LRASANTSYDHAARDLARYTGIYVSGKTQQRIVHRHQFPEWNHPQAVKELSTDGGKVRLRSEEKEKGSQWRDYKAVSTEQSQVMAFYQAKEQLISTVNAQPLASTVTCLGDGHPGIWNLVENYHPQGERREVLDWFHLMENLHKVGGSLKRIAQAETLLWEGKVEETLNLFEGLKGKSFLNFRAYLENHRHRLIDYQYHQQNAICSIGSGAVESSIKQIDRRLKISGAQWKEENVPQVLRHRCAYLNDALFA
jgi:hypothetical protein